MTFDLTYSKGKVEIPIGKTINLFKVFGENTKDGFIPIIFLLNTSDSECNRFFIDAWSLHWSVYNMTEMTELIREDLEEFSSDEVIDLMEQYQLKGKTILSIEMDYIKKSDLLTGKLTLEVKDGFQMELLDFGDENEQILNIKNVG